jgi:hypothetical protein
MWPGLQAAWAPLRAASIPTQVFRSKIGSMRKGLKSRFQEFVFIDAPYEVTLAPYQQLGCADWADEDIHHSHPLGLILPAGLGELAGLCI